VHTKKNDVFFLHRGKRPAVRRRGLAAHGWLLAAEEQHKEAGPSWSHMLATAPPVSRGAEVASGGRHRHKTRHVRRGKGYVLTLRPSHGQVGCGGRGGAGY
jgi:hypothetical protein